MNWHDSPESKKKVRNEFTHGNICANIKAATPKLAEIYSELYDRVIDYGAHPNERGASLNSMMEDTMDGGKRYSTVYLQDDGLPLDFGLKTAIQVGIWVLKIAQVIYPLRFQAMGISYQLEDISKRF